MTSTNQTNEVKPTRPKQRLIKARLERQDDQERFDGLVQMSGLSQSDYIRRCCLEAELKVVPDHNFLVYAALGKVQLQINQAMRAAMEAESPEATQALLTVALQTVKTMRQTLLGQTEKITPQVE